MFTLDDFDFLSDLGEVSEVNDPPQMGSDPDYHSQSTLYALIHTLNPIFRS